MATLAQRLGYDAEARVLIISAGALGSSHAANAGVYQAVREGLATTAGLMVPCPWAREAAARYRGEDVGVHLTLNSEHDLYRWGPITRAPSLLDGDGGFPRSLGDLWDHADVDEVRRECRAQVERAILWGFDVSHLGTHLDAMELRPELFDVYLELACEFGLPLRLGPVEDERRAGFPFRALAEAEGLVFPDSTVGVHGVGTRRALERALGDLAPGVTEVRVHPAQATPELRAYAPDWPARVDDLELVTESAKLALSGAAGSGTAGSGTVMAAVRRWGGHLVGFRELRNLMRGE